MKKPPPEPLEGSWPDSILLQTSGLQHCKINFCCLKLPSLWYFVMESNKPAFRNLVLYSRGWQTMVHRSHATHHLFLYGLQSKFYVFFQKTFEINLRIQNINFETQLSVMLSPILNFIICSFLLYEYLHNIYDFASWPVKPKIFSIRSFTEKVR